MTITVKSLGKGTGIQYTGVIDNSSVSNSNSMGDALVIGYFRRGSLDRVMNINKSNIRALLGYDPLNPSYIAVQDILDQNVANVRVLRISEMYVPANDIVSEV